MDITQVTKALYSGRFFHIMYVDIKWECSLSNGDVQLRPVEHPELSNKALNLQGFLSLLKKGHITVQLSLL